MRANARALLEYDLAPRRGGAQGSERTDMSVSFGVFDHLDSKDAPLQQIYEERLRLIEDYDRLGFYAYHLAEHQGTPLGLAPSPSVFLAAIAQRSKRLRFGPLVYVLPLYNPLRLATEICMLDHMSGGRLDVGIGRGISAFEVAFFGVSHLESADVFREAYQVLIAALTTEKLRHRGTFYKFLDVPMVLRPLQQPHPPLWYGPGSARSAEWAAREGMNIVSNAPCGPTRLVFDAFRRADEAGPRRGASAKAGIARHVYVAETDEEASRICKRAAAAWFASFSKLWRDNGAMPMRYPSDFEELRRQDAFICGSPATVATEIERQIDASGCNYFVTRFAYGDLTYDEAARSLALFAAEIMPKFRDSSAAPRRALGAA